MTDLNPTASNQDSLPASDGRPPLPVVRSEELLGGQKEILIEHSGEMYRLRLTRNGKLILQK